MAANRKAGFSLTEVMIAFAIFALVMTSVFWCMIMAQRMGQSARNRLAALQSARAELEEVVGASYDGAALSVGAHSVSRGGFQGRYEVSEPLPGERKRVAMSFEYPSFGRTATVELQMELSNALH